ncbi:MAG: pantoate--beta-alanine ligase [Candidatus Delongbacteria bacterium]|nr:pantoate--beta-alanine ligase [Candidatus Delongbacteria bacterium]
MPKILKTISEVKDFTSLYNLVNRRIGFVPTMGALHEGHLELGKKAMKECDCVIYSIFVNPIQFGENEDLGRYPKDIQGDIEKLDSIGVDAIFLPDEKVMYAEDFSTYVDLGDITNILCGRSRPGHFRGVATVVLKLFNIMGCDQAYFGKKDYQQFVILKKMVKELNVPVEIIGVDTVREDDGLAMSSRNSYLNEAERKASPVLFRALSSVRQNLSKFETADEIINYAQEIVNSEKLARIEYIEVRNADDLTEVSKIDSRKIVMLTAVRFGTTRLIDNLILN